MKLGVINSFLVVCFLQWFLKFFIKSVNIYKIHEKYHIMAIKQQLWNIAINLQSFQEVFYQFYQLFVSRQSID